MADPTRALAAGAMPPRVGDVMDGFRLDRELGRGQYGVVFGATDLRLNRQAAIKVPLLDARDPAALPRFWREAQALAQLRHPGVVSIYTLGSSTAGQPYLVMEHLPGTTLEARLAHWTPSPREVCELGHQLALALCAVHAAGIVHRDLKPDNIMCVAPIADEPVRLVLIDFGIAKPAQDAQPHQAALTGVGHLIGTPHYMAPEQVSGDALDGRADIYALGVVLHRMLTGRVPFEGSSLDVVVQKVARPTPSVDELRTRMPMPLAKLVHACLHAKPEDRMADAAQLATALARASDALDGTAATMPLPATSAVTQPARPRAPTAATRGRRRGWIVLATGIALGSGVTWAIGAITSPPSPAAAIDAGAGTVPIDAPGPAPADAAGAAATRALFVDDGEFAMRVRVPVQLTVGVRLDLRFELWDGAGAAIEAGELVVTIEDGRGQARGFAAHPSGRGDFVLPHEFTMAGPHTMRVFPPIGSAALAVDIDVAAVGAGRLP